MKIIKSYSREKNGKRHNLFLLSNTSGQLWMELATIVVYFMWFLFFAVKIVEWHASKDKQKL